ncbi:transmembrane and coiled-coil domain-containing protein 3-like isoform X2 [Lineus longissimus]|uniref:transmembrane and coiled-coil domain-containing protein 3-like isoform X2 n=1 Tax=Lineus longissimus TaxID=88925 RepID=UPI00315CF5FF
MAVQKMKVLQYGLVLLLLLTFYSDFTSAKHDEKEKRAIRLFERNDQKRDPEPKRVPGAQARATVKPQRKLNAVELKRSEDVEKSKFVDSKNIPAKGAEWQNSQCKNLQHLMKRKQFAVKKIDEAIHRLVNNTKLAQSDIEFRVKTLKVFQAELEDSARLTFEVLDWLQQALQGNYKDFENIKKSSQMRLALLRDVTLSEEQMFNILIEAEKSQEEKIEKEQQTNGNGTHVESILSGILLEVAKAADRLERDLNDHVFDNAVKENAQDKGANIEAVIRLHDTDNNKNKTASQGDEGGAMKLVDAHDNQYVLSKGKDSTVPVEDHHFIEDVIFLTLLAFIFGWLCTLVQLPNMFGYILSGVVLGPSGLSCIKSVVQVETLGEFGVFFILFSVGLEFSPDKLKRVFRIATVGSFLMMALTILFGVLIGHCIKSTPNESAFISACLSLSSTPLVVKFIGNGKDEEENTNHESAVEHHRGRRRTDLDYSSVLLGILVMQDILLGVLIALLPAIAGHASSDEISANDLVLEYFHLGVKLVASFIAIILLTFVLAKFLIGPVYKFLFSRGNREMSMLATIVIAFTMLMVTNFLNISMELGCFLAGAIVSSQGHHVAEQVGRLISSVKDFLGCLFFASIGLHVFPTFLAFEITILTTFTLAIVGFKFFSNVAVLHFLLPKHSRPVKWIVSAGLAQVSEFSFVLGSRARRLGLISREVYLVILSVTTLSLLFAPVLWYATLWHLRLKSLAPARTRSRHTSLETLESDTTREEITSNSYDGIGMSSPHHVHNVDMMNGLGHLRSEPDS